MYLKGDGFVNRYRLTGRLTALSSTHIGSGEVRENSPSKKEDSEPVEVSLIVTDLRNKPYIPGSSLRGVIRHYLRNIFLGLGKKELAQDQDFESGQFKEMPQEKQIEYMKNKASLLELLFGTPFAEGKIEIWDAPAMNIVEGTEFKEKGWNPERNTYEVKSVAIDPTTGAALPHKLYTFEVAPPGLCYEVNIVGQNIEDAEFGMFLFGLEAFNSEIFPLTIGAMAGRGFGRMSFNLEKIYRLAKEDLKTWIQQASANEHAGYHALFNVTDQKEKFIQQFKDAFINKLGS